MPRGLARRSGKGSSPPTRCSSTWLPMTSACKRGRRRWTRATRTPRVIGSQPAPTGPAGPGASRTVRQDPGRVGCVTGRRWRGASQVPVLARTGLAGQRSPAASRGVPGEAPRVLPHRPSTTASQAPRPGRGQAREGWSTAVPRLRPGWCGRWRAVRLPRPRPRQGRCKRRQAREGWSTAVPRPRPRRCGRRRAVRLPRPRPRQGRCKRRQAREGFPGARSGGDTTGVSSSAAGAARTC